MKKFISCLFIISAVLFASSCKKESSNATKHPVSKVMVDQYSSEGVIHNYIVDIYRATYGFPSSSVETTPLTQAQVSTVVYRCASIANSIFGNDPATTTSTIMSGLSDNFYTDNGTTYLMSQDDINIMTANSFTNTNIKNVLLAINSYTDSDVVAYATTQFDALQGLTSTEQTFVTQYLSILSNSWGYWSDHREALSWSDLPSPGKLLKLAVADASGYAKGFLLGGINPVITTTVAAASSINAW